MKMFGSSYCFALTLSSLLKKCRYFDYIDLLLINNYYQLQVADDVLDSVMHWFFLTQSL